MCSCGAAGFSGLWANTGNTEHELQHSILHRFGSLRVRGSGGITSPKDCRKTGFQEGGRDGGSTVHTTVTQVCTECLGLGLHHETLHRAPQSASLLLLWLWGKPAAEQMDYLGAVFLCVCSCWCSEGRKSTLHHLRWKLSSLEVAIPHQEPKTSSTRASLDSSSSPEGICLIFHRRKTKSHV